MTRNILVHAFGLALVSFATLANAADEPATSATTATSTDLVQTFDMGQILANTDGLTLYVFDKEIAGTPVCTDSDGCSAVWNPLTTTDAALPAPFGLVPRADGAIQVTSGGRPLYHFAGDTAPGQLKGDGEFGLWHPARPSCAIAPSDLLQIRDLGNIFTDTTGLSLYVFDKDTPTSSACLSDDACDVIWPPLTTTETSLPAPFGLVARPDGKMQVTHQGHLLYRFYQDAALGQVKGDGFGGLWHLARP
jgi:predicted lipoprotein with Yx(FWY)xxD motif